MKSVIRIVKNIFSIQIVFCMYLFIQIVKDFFEYAAFEVNLIVGVPFNIIYKEPLLIKIDLISYFGHMRIVSSALN